MRGMLIVLTVFNRSSWTVQQSRRTVHGCLCRTSLYLLYSGALFIGNPLKEFEIFRFFYWVWSTDWTVLLLVAANGCLTHAPSLSPSVRAPIELLERCVQRENSFRPVRRGDSAKCILNFCKIKKFRHREVCVECCEWYPVCSRCPIGQPPSVFIFCLNESPGCLPWIYRHLQIGRRSPPDQTPISIGTTCVRAV